ncbi:MAG TPA: HDOD domain-containing protein [Steroidobacteraceae bacterium]|jgi:EAL and modified HD-GYP domain-containing signal transduction protein|nr:HDOD domain-containing protein [Steroidobacteraceae bacterium]
MGIETLRPVADRKPAPPHGERAEGESLALVARQPIYDAGIAVTAYELLYRESASALKAMVFDAKRATLRVIANAALEIGLDRLANGLPVHINFPRELLVGDPMLPLQPEAVVIEVLEDVPADADVLAGIRALRKRGHRIALDDYTARESDRALLDVADIVKIALSRENPDELERTVRELKARGLKLIAEEVETVEQFDRCLELGFDGFQGYFLQHPQTFQAQRLPSNKIGTLRLLTELTREDVSIGDIEKILSQDMSMSYRVLRCINSSFYNLPRKVDSIRQAIVILGLDPLRQLCSLVALQGFDDRPPSLLITAMARARMCEQLGRLAGANDTGPYFITGLFSMLNVLTGMPIDKLVEELPLAKPVELALVKENGELGAALHCVRAYERGHWQEVSFHGLPHPVIRAAYVDAVFWAEQARALMRA